MAGAADSGGDRVFAEEAFGHRRYQVDTGGEVDLGTPVVGNDGYAVETAQFGDASTFG